MVTEGQCISLTHPSLSLSLSLSLSPAAQLSAGVTAGVALGVVGGRGLTKAEFLEQVRRSNAACERGDFAAAVGLYSEALRSDPQNCILYSNRSAALLKLGQHQSALEDAVKARLLNGKWPKVRALPPPPLPPWTRGQVLVITQEPQQGLGLNLMNGVMLHRSVLRGHRA